MALEFRATGTIRELEQLYSWTDLAPMIHVDEYKRCMVPDDEVFTITTEHLIAAGIVDQGV